MTRLKRGLLLSLKDTSIEMKLKKQTTISYSTDEVLHQLPYPVLIINQFTGKISFLNALGMEMLGPELKSDSHYYSDFFQSPPLYELSTLHNQNIELLGKNNNKEQLTCKALVKILGEDQESIAIYINDVNKLKEASPISQQLKHTSGLLKTLLHHIHDAVMIYDLKGELLVYNKTAEKYIDDHLLYSNTPDYGFFSSDGSDQYDLKKIFLTELESTQDQIQLELLVKNKNYPQGIFVESFWANITDITGKKMGTISVFHDINKSKSYEKDLLQKIQFEKLLTEISGYFIRLNSDELTEGMQHILKQVKYFFDFEGAFITLKSSENFPDHELIFVSHFTGKQPFKFSKDNPLNHSAWLRDTLRQNKDVLIQDIQDIPAIAHHDKEYLLKNNVKSLIIIPIVSTESARGFIGLFDHQSRSFGHDFINKLRLVGKIMVSALQREQKEKEIRLLNTSLEQRVLQRTKELEESNLFLEEEMNNRLKIQKELLKKTLQLEATNREMESFSYSVSHDLRAPLRGINGFSRALMEDYEEQLDEIAMDFLNRIILASQKMGNLIDGLLSLSHLSRKELHHERIHMSKLVSNIICNLLDNEPNRKTDIHIQPDLVIYGDMKLIEIALENLISNAWKFSNTKEAVYIEIGSTAREDQEIFYIRDKGVGFDMQYAKNLFQAFYRLHSPQEFKGSGIGLATVKRIINKHGGHIWAESVLSKGATFYFVLNTKTIE